MPTASRAIRKVRRIKRERSIAFRSLNHMIMEYEKMRAYAHHLKTELDTLKPQVDVVKSPKTTITSIEDPEPLGTV